MIFRTIFILIPLLLIAIILKIAGVIELSWIMLYGACSLGCCTIIAIDAMIIYTGSLKRFRYTLKAKYGKVKAGSWQYYIPGRKARSIYAGR